ncbi:hypothetical protein Celaphus_00000321 [Cervus elaphus hippelaphus]|uniref:Uncharacterized protein n=1 Tax=Cervus elaphus hippelaphus TaxID=46360 RepID=A0A212D9N5_CEREH|nr:hypothetical protein Celaphus_00000321 [Cervus elaphus hippelaphus]
MPQQRQDQHHQSTMMHPASAAGPPIVATPPAYSTQYVAYSPQQFPNQPLVQHVPHYQSQHPHVYSPVIQGNARMMAPPTHAQPGLVSSSATQYGAHEQTHAMYVSTGSLAQQYAHPNATLHPHTPHPQPSATPTGQQQSQHGGSHPAPSPVQHHQHQAAQALHLASPQQQSAIYHAGLAPTPPSMTPASNTQSPQNSFPAAQQTVFTIHPSHVQPAYTNPPHMAHVPQPQPSERNTVDMLFKLEMLPVCVKELSVSGSCTVRNGSFSSNCPCANDANDDTATRRSPGRPRSKCTTAHSSLDNSAFPLYDAPFSTSPPPTAVVRLPWRNRKAKFPPPFYCFYQLEAQKTRISLFCFEKIYVDFL